MTKPSDKPEEPVSTLRIATRQILFASLLVLIVAPTAVIPLMLFFPGSTDLFQHAEIVTILLFMFGLVWIIGIIRTRVMVYSWGLDYRRLFRRITIRWEDIRQITLSGSGQLGFDPCANAIFHFPGGKLNLGRFEQTAASIVGDAIIKRIAPELARKLDVRIRAGEEISVAHVRLTRRGIELAGNSLLWQEIDAIGFAPTGMQVSVRDQPERTLILAYSVPDLHVLRYLFLSMSESALRDRLSVPPRAPATAAVGGVTATERVKGFPDQDPALGQLVCGLPCTSQRVLTMLLIGTVVGLAVFVVCFIKYPSEEMGIRVVSGLAAVGCAAVWAMGRFAGFAVYERGGRTKKASLRWEDCRHVTYEVVNKYLNGIFTGTSRTFLLEGEHSKIKFRDESTLGDGVALAALDRLLPGLIERTMREIEMGKTFKVERLEVRARSLVCEGEEAPFERISSHEVREGYLHIWKTVQEKSWAIVSLGARDGRVLLVLLPSIMEKSRNGVDRVDP